MVVVDITTDGGDGDFIVTIIEISRNVLQELVFNNGVSGSLCSLYCVIWQDQLSLVDMSTHHW